MRGKSISSPRPVTRGSIRRRDPTFDGKLRPYLFTSGSIVEREDAVERGADGNGSRGPASPRPTIGSLRGGR